MDLKSHIGIRLKSARRHAGLTQAGLAEAVGKATETISNIERGHSLTSLETLELIAKKLGTPLASFVEGYPPGRRTTRRRAELQQQLLDTIEQLPDHQISIAVRLIEALKGKHATP
jgi:transcriptional regulator with XRE-family HTH domain